MANMIGHITHLYRSHVVSFVIWVQMDIPLQNKYGHIVTEPNPPKPSLVELIQNA